LEVYHRSACRVISSCLASTPFPLLLLESLTTPLEITLNHQALAFFERALRFLADNFPLQQLASRLVQPRLKKRPSWRSFCSSQENQFHREKLILCPSAPPWTSPKLHCDRFHRRLLPLWPRPIRCCSRLSSKTPLIWCCRMDRWLCPLSFGRRRCRCPCGLRKMLILLLAVLLSWPCLL